MRQSFLRIPFAGILAVFLCAGHSFAAGDGFGSFRKIESGHFTIHYAPGLDPAELARELDVRASDRVASGSSYRSDLAGMIDTLFSQVCDILDMQLYSFQGTIKICRDFDHIAAVYENLFGKDLRKSKSHSFYMYDFNTVYVSAAHFKREILGHEIGHAVISHYFVVLPSVKIQEVLAVFVEYQLRKLY